MRNTNERLMAAMTRSEEILATTKRRNQLIRITASTVCSFACICILAFCMPQITARMPGTENSELAIGQVQMAASVFANNSVIGYLIIGLLAFLLGVSVTILCMLLHQREQEESKHEH